MTTRDDSMRPTVAAIADRLPRNVEPPPEIWERIAARLEPRDAAVLDDRLFSLPTEIAPPADLWPAIAARLSAAAPRRKRAAAAASAAVLTAAVLLGALLLRPEPADRDAQPTAPTAARNDDAAGHGAPSTALVGAWMLGMPEISADVAVTMQRELALVRDERMRIERAIEQEPDNVELRELWAYTFQVELELADACGRTVMAYERG